MYVLASVTDLCQHIDPEICAGGRIILVLPIIMKIGLNANRSGYRFESIVFPTKLVLVRFGLFQANFGKDCPLTLKPRL